MSDVRFVVLTPWKGFDHNADTGYAAALRAVSCRLADGEWHDIAELTNSVATEYGLDRRTIQSMLSDLDRYGEVYRKSGKRGGGRFRLVRLAGRYL